MPAPEVSLIIYFLLSLFADFFFLFVYSCLFELIAT